MRVWSRRSVRRSPGTAVLCVDDDPGVVVSLRRLLQKEPYAFLSATSSAEALDLLGRHPVGLVLADHRMPGMCGADLLGEVQRRFPRTRRVMLTAHPSSFRIQVGLGREIEWIIGKPWNDEALRLIIRWFLDWRGRPLPAPFPRRA